MDGWTVNREGSVWVFYQAGFQCAQVGESPQHMSLRISSQVLSAPVYFSFVHAKCTEQERALLWSALLVDKPSEDPWLVVGDFNTIVSAEEKRGGLPFRVDEGVEMRTFMSGSGVFDAALMGLNFGVRHLGREPSDHAPLLLSASTRLDNKPRSFRFLNVWTSKLELLDVIRTSWSTFCPGRPLQRLAAKLQHVKRALQLWSRVHFGNIFDAVKQAEEAVMAAEAAFDSDNSQHQWLALQEARAVMRQSLVKKEAYWRQKARIKWLQDRDKNSRFFHAVVAERRAKSVIHQIRSREGEWLTDEAQISAEAVDYFTSLFFVEPCPGSWRTLEVIPKIISREQNDELERLPSMEEIREVVFAMDGESAAGPDGFTGRFFTFAWDVVGQDVLEAVVSFFCGHELPRSVSLTLIVLIPKVSSPQDFSQFRPISLCNFVNKVISKTLAARVAKVLPSIISPQQSGFVKGRQIFDNFLLAQELVSDIHRKNRGGNVVLKLDMAKAYDRVSWPFLLQVLRRFGFGEVWIDMIWRLISNVWFSWFAAICAVGDEGAGRICLSVRLKGESAKELCLGSSQFSQGKETAYCGGDWVSVEGVSGQIFGLSFICRAAEEMLLCRGL
ncbi:uncharacterized protein [Coffea arabica]|uniref:Reverse transcriptase domain-containing protein n=1 Tax=Coffea arabica TaxID=13443 RepID=A0ABM4X7R5_COFAR